MKLLIKNITIITINKNREILENHNIMIKGRIIESILSEIELENKLDKENIVFDKIIDGENKIIIPGLINSHTHIPMSLFRSLGDNVEDRLNKLLIPLENNLLDKDMVYKATKFTIGEMVSSGTTCYGDMYFFANEMAKATEEIGIRGVIGQTIVDKKSPDAENFVEGFERFEDFYKKYSDSKLITPAIAPHAPYSNTIESLKKSSEISKKYDIPLMIHLSEMEFEEKKYSEYGSSVKFLDSLGILDENTVGAHGIFLSNEDMEILKEKEVSIAHCPIGNAKSARPIAKAYKLLKKGINVSLGTDGSMSGNHMDMINVMGVTPLMQKHLLKDRSLMTAQEILEMATINGAKSLGLESQIGSIEVSKLADLVIINPNTFNMLPIYDYYSALVYSMQRNNIEMVLVDGQLIYNNELVNGSETEIVKDFLGEVEKVKSRSIKLLKEAENKNKE